MQKSLIILVLVLVNLASISNAQQFTMPDHLDEFGNQVRNNFGTVSTELALNTGEDFAKLWTGLGPDIRAKIMNQAKVMNEKNYPFPGYFVPYFEMLVLARNKENLDDIKFS